MAPIVASLILFAALLLVASAATGAAWTSPGEPRLAPSAERLPAAAAAERVQAVPVAIACPREERPLQVVLGIDPGLRTPALTVLSCEHFGGGEVACDMACLGAPVPA